MSSIDLSRLNLSKDFYTEVNKGNVPGHEMLAVVGSSSDVQTTFTDIWKAGSGLDMIYPTSGETWEIVMSNVNDTAAGTGAQEVTIVSIDVTGAEQVTVQATNGGTQVLSGAHFDIQSINVTATGTVRGFNLGTITLQVSGGGNVRARILMGGMNDYNSHYTVPLGHTAFWQQAFVDSIKGEDTSVRPLVQIGGVGPFHVGGESSTYQNSFHYPFLVDLALTEGSRILQQAKSTNSGVLITSIMEFVVIENSFVDSSGTSQITWLP